MKQQSVADLTNVLLTLGSPFAELPLCQRCNGRAYPTESYKNLQWCYLLFHMHLNIEGKEMLVTNVSEKQALEQQCIMMQS